MSVEQLRDRILGFVNSSLLPPGGSVANANTPLFDGGLLNSMRVLDLIAFVELEIGRPLPDSAIRLANFRTVSAIAATALDPVSSRAPRGDRIWSRARSRRGAAPVPRRGSITDDVLRWARDLHATLVEPGPLIPVDVLARAGYLESFPGRAVLVEPCSAEADIRPAAVPPAACMHCYEMLARTRLERSPLVLTLCSRCARGDEAVDPDRGRFREFTMREIVVVGSSAEVERTRRALMRRVQAHVTRLDLAASIDAAADPFHAPGDRGKQALQRLRALKYELRMPVAGAQIAVASFNHHEDFFGRAFDITLADGTAAHTGCVAFGLERWELAICAQRASVGGAPEAAKSA